MITRIPVNCLLAVLILFATACKKEKKSEGTPDPVVPAGATFSVENKTAPSIKIEAGAKMDLLVKMKMPAGVKSLKVTLIQVASSVKETLLDSSFTKDTGELNMNYTLKLKKYAVTKLQLVFIATDKKGDTLQRIVNLDYFNKLSFVKYIELDRSGPGWPYGGYDLVNNKVINGYDGPEFSIMYKANTTDNFYPVLSAGSGNGATFARCSFPGVADSMITVDMVSDAIGSLNFTATVPINSYKMLVLVKLPANIYKKPWSLLSVWDYTTYSQNASGSSWFGGRINAGLFEFPTNY